MDHQCAGHAALDAKIGNIETATSDICANLKVMAKTMTKLEDNNIQIVALRGEVAAISKAFDKSEREHDELFLRLRGIEEVGCNPRLNHLEEIQGKCQPVLDLKANQDRMIWGGIVMVGLAMVVTVIKAVWK